MRAKHTYRAGEKASGSSAANTGPHSVLYVALCILFGALCAQAQDTNRADRTLAQGLCAGYRSIESISCDVRKTTRMGKQTVRMLRRVFYRKPQRIHVENISPMKRRIIVDGARLYYHEQDAPRGFSRPLQDLSAQWRDSIDDVPATPIKHLLPLEDVPEQSLPSTPEAPVRAAYHTEKVTVVLACDATGRLARVQFFRSPAMTTMIARYEYSNFVRAGKDVWIPCLHKGCIRLPDSEEVTETRRIDNLHVNEPLADSLFDPGKFFGNIEFSDDFGKTYQP